jgi:hypothetical protein
MRCPRKFGYKEIERIVPRVTPRPLALGTCIHDGLAAFYLGRDPLAALRDVSASCAWCIPAAKPVIAAYVKQKTNERVNVLAVEKEFAVKVGGRTFTRRIDLVVEERGRVVVRDHKTSGDVLKRMSSFSFDGSLFTQEIVGKATLPAEYQLPWGGVQVNLISMRAPYPARYVPVSWEPNFINTRDKGGRDLAADDLAYWARIAELWVEKKASGWSLPRSWRCRGEYGDCEYLPLCLRGEVELGGFVREDV